MLMLLKALADATRLRLLAIFFHGEFTVQEVTTILGMGQSRISRHLKIMTEAGVLSVKRQGTWSYYRLDETNPKLLELGPVLERRLDELPERRRDLDGLAHVIEARRLKSLEFFDRHARQWDSLAGNILPVPPYRQILLAELPVCRTALEVGTGTGALLQALRRKADTVIGVDHSPAMLEQAGERITREGLSGIDLRLGDLSHLPVGDGSVQSVLLNMVLHHAPQPAAVLKELNRVLSPGGVLIIADLQRHEREWIREKMADQWLGFDRQELWTWLQGAAFTLRSFRVVEGKAGEQPVIIAVAVKSVVGTTG